MKKRFIVSVLVIMSAISGSLYAQAQAFGGGCGSPGEGAGGMHEKRHGGKLEMMARVLELSEEQQAQVQEIMEEERALMETRRQDVREGREKIHQLVTSAAFDEEKVRTLVEQQGSVRTELAVAKARTHHRIWSLLTAEQRELAEKLKPLFEGHGPRRGH